jgi:hypothetical protein
LDGYPLEKIGSLKAKAISTPWMTERKQELAKFYYAWITVCRLSVDWDEEIDEHGFLDTELAECLEGIGSGNSSHLHVFNSPIGFETPEQYLLGRLVIHIKTLSDKNEEARNIWNLMLKSNSSKCDYWLDRIGWER